MIVPISKRYIQMPLCGQNAECVNVEPGGTHSNHWALKDHAVNTVDMLPACKCLYLTAGKGIHNPGSEFNLKFEIPRS